MRVEQDPRPGFRLLSCLGACVVWLAASRAPAFGLASQSAASPAFTGRPSSSPASQSWFGQSIAVLDDLDGDGCSEIAVGSPWPSLEGRGAVGVYSSKTHALLKRVSATAEESSFGAGLCVIGATNGRARGILVRAETTRRVGTKNETFERIVLLTLPALERAWTIEDQPRSFVEEGILGCNLPDTDGDGIGEIAVGMSGGVAIASGKTGEILRRIAPEHASPRFGWSLTPCDDLDGDGLADFAIGDPGELYSNESEGKVRACSTRSGALLWSSPESSASDMGFAMDIVGDLDHDGVRDLAVSKYVPFADGVVLVSGKTGSPIRELDRNDLKHEAAYVVPCLGFRVRAGGTFGAEHVRGLVVTRYGPKCPGAQGQAVWVMSLQGRLLAEILPPGIMQRSPANVRAKK